MNTRQGATAESSRADTSTRLDRAPGHGLGPDDTPAQRADLCSRNFPELMRRLARAPVAERRGVGRTGRSLGALDSGTSRRVVAALGIMAVIGLAPIVTAATPAGAAACSGPAHSYAQVLNTAYLSIADSPCGRGYWTMDAAGGVFTHGAAPYHGSVPGLRNAGISIPQVDAVSLAVTPSGRGYWVMDAAGGVFDFGDARFYGSVPGLRKAGHAIPDTAAVSLAATPTGRGYWVMDAAGGVFAFGDAEYHGSVPGLRNAGHAIPDSDAVSLSPTPSGRGYWVMDAAGGVFNFGDARFHGSAAPVYAGEGDVPATMLAPNDRGDGYRVLYANGAVAAFGAATHEGSSGGSVFVPGFHRRYRGSITVSAGGTAPSTLTQEIVDRLNQERRARGTGQLRWDATLGDAAQSWSRLMASSGARHGGMRLVPGGRFSALGENIFELVPSQSTARDAHVGWMGSSTHRRNMLNPGYDAVGVGTTCSGGRLFAVQIFGRSPSHGGASAGSFGTPSSSPLDRGEPGGARC